MPQLTLFYRLILRPMLREPGRTLLMVIAIAVGASVVLAIDLASEAAAGSFHSSMESFSGDNDLELTAVGGVDERCVGLLDTQPEPLRVTPRIEEYARIVQDGETVPLIGLDLVAESGRYAKEPAQLLPSGWNPFSPARKQDGAMAIWVTADLGFKADDQVELQINDTRTLFRVAGVLPASAPSGTSAILMDIADAQQVTGRRGTVDRILLKIPPGESMEQWQSRLAKLLPAGVSIQPQGTKTAANRKMLSAFRWNLRILSYVALLVGAFLIYNTISVSVARRRPEIGTLRALGASRLLLLGAFLAEAFALGLAGTLCAVPLGRLLATFTVRMLSLTINMLYVSSTAGGLHLSASTLLLVFVSGIGVSLLAAIAPAREASLVAPTEAMARGARDHDVQQARRQLAWYSLASGAIALSLSFLPPLAGKPIGGYAATLFLVAAAALLMPLVVHGSMRATSGVLQRLFGIEALLAARSLSGSLRRTAVLVAALATAVAMMTSVAIMVGSFRQTVLLWMDKELPADLYLRASGTAATDRHPQIAPALAAKIASLPGVLAVTRFYAFESDYQGLPVSIAAIDTNAPESGRDAGFFSGRTSSQVLRELEEPGTVTISEPFAYKHSLRAGDSILLPLGSTVARVRIIDIFYDYGNEHGYLVMSRKNMLQYLPALPTSNLAVYLQPGAQTEAVRHAVQQAIGGQDVVVLTNAELRREAVRIFDQTFTITYALEAIAVLVAIMGVAGALVSIVLDRRREFGLLRFLGASSAQIKKMILYESACIGLLSSIAGLCLGYLLSLLLIFVINRQSFGWTIRFHWPLPVLSAALGTVFLATVLAALYPARIAQGLNPIDVIHEE